MEQTQIQVEKERILDALKTTIEKMPKDRHLEILRKLKKHSNKVCLNPNRNGVYVNLSYLPDNVLEEIQAYVSYVQEQEAKLDGMEKQKHEILETFSHKDVAILPIPNPNSSPIPLIPIPMSIPLPPGIEF